LPRLILFAPCGRVIVGMDDGAVTLVGLLDGIEAATDADGALAPVADLRWDYLAVWQAGSDDAGRTFEQRMEVVRPDRTVAAEARRAFAFETPTVRVRGSVAGFPVAMPGVHLIRLSVRDVADGEVWERVAEYPVSVTHPPTSQPSETPPQRRAARPRGRGASRRTSP